MSLPNQGSRGNPFHESNRKSWNAATRAHNSHKRDQAAFFRKGGTTLFPEELDLLGEVTGRRIVHLQCNSGQDTLCLARLGASITGVDISDEAIAFAQRLSADSGIDAAFCRADVLDWFETATAARDRFDVVFCSYGTICWLSDLRRWAQGVASVLVPGGRLVIVDFHPASMMFNERFDLQYPYFASGEPLKWDDGIRDYVAVAGAALTPSGYEAGVTDFDDPHAAYEFQWDLGSLFTAVLDAGLHVQRFVEYPYSNGAKLFEGMQEAPGKRMYPPEDRPSLPLMFGLVAHV